MASDVKVAPELSPKIYGCCSNKQSAICYCVFCKSLLHQNCAVEEKNFKIIDDILGVCDCRKNITAIKDLKAREAKSVKEVLVIYERDISKIKTDYVNKCRKCEQKIKELGEKIKQLKVNKKDCNVTKNEETKLNEIISLIQNNSSKIDDVKNKLILSRRTYAESLKQENFSQVQELNTLPTICVQKKNIKNGEKVTKEEIKKLIDLNKIGAIPKFIKETGKGKVLIGGETAKDIQKLENELKLKMNNTCTVEIVALKKPKLKIIL